MQPQYLIRFDDICPTMKWQMWDRIEKILVEQTIRPILAVVPDNQDENLMIEEADLNFWTRVRSWQARRWTIGIHGYQHVYVTNQAGLVGIKNRSEFACLEEHQQESKLKSALAIFQREGITPQVWIAPGHSFDIITLRVLKKLGLNVVSDGLYLFPNMDSHGITYIPQQLWRFRRMPFGLWTVCYHHNDWTGRDLDRFKSEVQCYKARLTNLPQALKEYRPRNRNLSDALVSRTFLFALQARSSMRRVFRARRASIEIPTNA
jgi:predicted deacetylase